MRRLAVVPLIMGVALFGLADPTFAGTDITVKTTDASPGGVGHFKSYGDIIQACDVQTDGYTVIAGLIMDGGNVGLVEDTTTNGKCVSEDFDYPEGKSVKLQVCLYKAGAFRFCSTQKAGTT